MIANYHTHTSRCGHASGEDCEYVEAAISSGLMTLGFSDHTPQFYDGEYYPVRQKMRPEQMDGYVDSILELRKSYAPDIRILLGLEAEYLPKTFEKLMAFIEPYPLDYLILGQHYLYNGNQGDPDVFSGTSSKVLLTQYVDQCIAAIETGRFLYIAHPDVMHYEGDAVFYQREMERLCRRAKELGIPLEMNLLGLGDGRHYPNPLFWEIASSVGNSVVLGADAHFPQHVYRKETVAKAKNMLGHLGLELIESIL